MIKKSYAKVNIFLKIVGLRDNYHELASRFVRVKSLYDIVEFQQYNSDRFIIDGNFGCNLEQNTIYKAYVQLSKISSKVQEYFDNHKVIVTKNIPEFAGLGGGSSNCATFILMVNKVCNLCMTKDQMAKLGSTIGADVPFFIYEYDSANVSGIGEIVEPFDETVPNIEVFTPNIKCNTGDIFKSFRNKFFHLTPDDEAKILFNLSSKEILERYSKEYLNDLYLPALDSNIKLKNLNLTQNYFFSGSGSSFFKISE